MPDEDTCPACDGSGEGTCANCGDSAQDCACDEPEIGECDQCDGTGKWVASD